MSISIDPGFKKKAWVITGIITLVVVVLLILKAAFSLFLLIMLSALIAILLRGTAWWLERKAGLEGWLSMSITVFVTLAIIIGLFWFIGVKLKTEVSTLTERLPQMVEQAREELNKLPLGDRLEEQLTSKDGKGSLRTIRSFFSSTFGVAGDVYVILMLTLFFTATPLVYVKGMVDLLPAGSRRRGHALIAQVGSGLYKWFVGTLFSMTVVAVLTYIGLAILGVPLALTLALTAGILAFVPNFGPLIALAIAMLVGLTESVQTALLIGALYMLVQILESNLIRPVIQKKMVEIPPALIITGQLLLGILSGGAIGLIVASPLMVTTMIIVRELWVERQNRMEVPG